MAGDEQPREHAVSSLSAAAAVPPSPPRAASKQAGAMCGDSSKDTRGGSIEEHEEEEKEQERMTGHPYGVKPWGNYLSGGTVEVSAFLCVVCFLRAVCVT